LNSFFAGLAHLSRHGSIVVQRIHGGGNQLRIGGRNKTILAIFN
jgi:hypothetical protein